jgi:outer membrane protein assembly factor BamB
MNLRASISITSFGLFAVTCLSPVAFSGNSSIAAAVVAPPLKRLVAQGSSSKNQQFTKADTSGQTLSDFKHSFTTALGDYKILGDGRGQFTDRHGRSRKFKIAMDNRVAINRLQYAVFGQDLLLLAEEEAADSGAGFMLRLDPKTFKVKWRRQIPAFAGGPGLLESHFAYVTGTGFIAKVNLNNGTYAWQHGNLYKDGKFTSFELPLIQGNEVIFEESTSENRQPQKIRVNKATGAILQKQ